MIEVDSLERKFADLWRPSVFEQLRAAGKANPEAEADRIVKAASCAYTAKVLARLAELLHQAHADSPQSLAVLFGPEERPEGETRAAWIARAATQKAKQREWVERKTAAALARLTIDDITLG